MHGCLASRGDGCGVYWNILFNTCGTRRVLACGGDAYRAGKRRHTSAHAGTRRHTRRHTGAFLDVRTGAITQRHAPGPITQPHTPGVACLHSAMLFHPPCPRLRATPDSRSGVHCVPPCQLIAVASPLFCIAWLVAKGHWVYTFSPLQLGNTYVRARFTYMGARLPRSHGKGRRYQ